jgi:hypothetical protein
MKYLKNNPFRLRQMLKTPDFKHAVVRDLAWVMSSPGLLCGPADDGRLVSDEWCQQTYIDYSAALLTLDDNPKPLMDYLSALKSHRLGFYFEMLLGYWLEHILKLSPFKKNVPVFRSLNDSGRRTLGEFDFVFADREVQVLQHWEATVKFYLHCKDELGAVRWLGPAGQDRLDIKLTRIFKHQLKLAQTTEGHAALENFPHESVNSSAFIKGYLFYPVAGGGGFDVENHSLSLLFPFKVSKEHLRGWWLRHGENTVPKQLVSSRWMVLSKRHWLSAAWCDDEESGRLLDGDGISEFCSHHFGNNDSSLLLAEMQAGINGWFEVSRGFIVCPSWPMVGR